MWLSDLADAARKSGLNVVEEPGWRTRGHGGMTAVRGIMWHHTAGAKAGNYPSLRLVRDGRPGLTGPLSQLGLARDGTVIVIAAGLAYHAGTGSWPGLSGNADCIGIEAESVGDGRDWTAAQREAMPRLTRALARHYGIPPDRVVGHLEWAPTRKVDPAGIDMDAIRAAINQEDDMPLTDEDLDKIAFRVWSLPLPANDPAAQAAHSWLRQAALPAVIEGASAQEIAAALPDDLARQVADELARRLQEA